MSGRWWSQDEIDYLYENLGQVRLKDIAKVLNRTEKAVLQKVYDLGISVKLDLSDKSLIKIAKENHAIKRSTYQKRKDQGLCTRCGKRWAEAGRTKCRPCYERDLEWYRANNTREYLKEYKQKIRAERKEKGLCVNCGAPLEPHEIGVNSKCARCRKKNMERTTVKRIQMRIHGIKRKR